VRGVNKDTARVLSSSAITGLSAWFRLYVGFLLLGKVPDKALCFAFSFVAYAVYTLDRALKSREDEMNRPEERNANTKAVLFIVFTFLFAAVLILISNKQSPFVVLIPVVMGFLYSKGVRIGSFSIKFKQGWGIKNLIVAFTWGFTIMAFLYNFTENYLQRLLIFIFFFLKSIIYTLICDCRDIKGDSSAGLITLPIYFGETRMRVILQILHSSFHLILVAFILLDLIKFETIILLYSWIAGVIYIPLYANNKKTIFRGLIVHGEWMYLLAFRQLAIQLSQNISQSI